MKTAFAHINKDLVALDDCIDCHQDECKKAQNELHMAKGRIEVMEERSCTQQEMLKTLAARVENMEGKLCHCGKGKEHKVREETSSVLGGPIILGCDINEGSTSNNSYCTPPWLVPLFLHLSGFHQLILSFSGLKPSTISLQSSG